MLQQLGRLPRTQLITNKDLSSSETVGGGGGGPRGEASRQNQRHFQRCQARHHAGQSCKAKTEEAKPVSDCFFHSVYEQEHMMFSGVIFMNVLWADVGSYLPSRRLQIQIFLSEKSSLAFMGVFREIKFQDFYHIFPNLLPAAHQCTGLKAFFFFFFFASDSSFNMEMRKNANLQGAEEHWF